MHIWVKVFCASLSNFRTLTRPSQVRSKRGAALFVGQVAVNFSIANGHNLRAVWQMGRSIAGLPWVCLRVAYTRDTQGITFAHGYLWASLFPPIWQWTKTKSNGQVVPYNPSTEHLTENTIVRIATTSWEPLCWNTARIRWLVACDRCYRPACVVSWGRFPRVWARNLCRILCHSACNGARKTEGEENK